MSRARSYWGWGWGDEAVDADGREKLRALLAFALDVSALSPLDPRPFALAEPRFAAPAAIRCLSHDPRERAAHTFGKAFRDVVRGLAGDFALAPDAVAFPEHEADIVALLDWCGDARIAVIPYGGGSSVVGGVEARVGDGYRGVLSLDLSRLCGVRAVDSVSRAARIGAGSFGPAIESELEPHGLTLRHYPQSFEQSTLGGWIATRAGGHFATLHTRIDDFVEALRVVTPSGVVETRRLPASGAGPQPERLWLGSEGALGVITEAWVRLQARPRFRASASVRFADFAKGVEAVRLLAQSGLHPANCRLLDAREALIAGAGDGVHSYLLVAFESADHGLDAWMARASEICRGASGDVEERAHRMPDDAASRWRRTFLRAPYLRDALVRLGAVTETFETAVTWDRFGALHAAVSEAATRAVGEVCGSGLVSCRITHAYPDGAAPYFTVIAPARAGSAVKQWDEIKAAVSEAILSAGGTITHHHAVGRDHRPWYDRERPEPFAAALRAAKRTLDPALILNPGVLVDAD